MTTVEMNNLIRVAIQKVQLEVELTWNKAFLNEAINNDNLEGMVKYGKNLSSLASKLVKVNESVDSDKKARKLYEYLRVRNSHMAERLNVNYVRKSYAYFLEEL